MKTWVWILGLWLVGIGYAQAIELKTAESLSYRLYWGPLAVGDARLEYRPQGESYVLKAEVVDDSALIDLHDVWETKGRHTPQRAFLPDVYKVMQAENKYRADKTMVFDRKVGKVIYTNHLDPTDTAEPLVLSDGRDVLSTVYAWRQIAESELKAAGRLPMVSLKRDVVLTRSVAVKDSVQIEGHNRKAWRVEMRVIKNGKPSKDLWTVYVSDDAQRVPLKIIAATKFGTFRALLK